MPSRPAGRGSAIVIVRADFHAPRERSSPSTHGSSTLLLRQRDAVSRWSALPVRRPNARDGTGEMASSCPSGSNIPGHPDGQDTPAGCDHRKGGEVGIVALPADVREDGTSDDRKHESDAVQNHAADRRWELRGGVAVHTTDGTARDQHTRYRKATTAANGPTKRRTDTSCSISRSSNLFGHGLTLGVGRR